MLITREEMARLLGDRGVKEAGLAGFFGFISSSCSFAALAASRSVLVKGAHPASVHYLFVLAGLMPEQRPALGEMIRFSVDHTLFLNITFLAVAGALFWLHLRGSQDQGRGGQRQGLNHRSIEGQVVGRAQQPEMVSLEPQGWPVPRALEQLFQGRRFHGVEIVRLRS